MPDLLVQQVTATVRWRESVEVVDAFLRGDEAALVHGVARAEQEDDNGFEEAEAGAEEEQEQEQEQEEEERRPRLYLELGPGSVCSGLARKCVSAGGAEFLSLGDDLDAMKRAFQTLQ